MSWTDACKLIGTEQADAQRLSCVGLARSVGLARVSHAAVLCPSFYKASIIYNPDKRDTQKQNWRKRIIGFLQKHYARKFALSVTG